MRAVSKVGQVLAWLTILGVGAVLAVAVVVPRLGGGTPYAVLTGSMQPNYPPGTLVVVRQVPFDEIAIGDVITYQLSSGQAEVVTHRVIGRTTLPDGTSRLLTQGDANGVPDAETVQEKQVRGRLWYAAPYLGRVNGVLTARDKQIGVYVVAGALIAYAAAMFLSAVGIGRRKPVTSDDVFAVETDTEASTEQERV